MRCCVLAVVTVLLLASTSTCSAGTRAAGTAAWLAGLDALAAGRWPEALAAFDGATEADDENADYHTSRGVALTLSGQFPTAIKEFQRALRLRDDAWEAKLWLGAACTMSGDPGTGAQYTTYAPQREGKAGLDYSLFVSMLANRYWQAARTSAAQATRDLQSTDFKRAAAMFAARRRAAAPTPLAGALLERVRVNMQGGQYAAALADLGSLLAAAPDDADLLQLHADASLALGDFSGARAGYTRVLTQRPAAAAAYLGRARAAAHLASATRARDDLALAAKLGAGGVDGARQAVERALAGPGLPDAVEALAALEKAAGERPDAAGLVDLALAVAQSVNARRLRYGELYQDGLRALDEALRAAPTDPDRMADLADYLFEESEVPFDRVEPRSWPVYWRHTVLSAPRFDPRGTLLAAPGLQRMAPEVDRASELAKAALAVRPAHAKASAVEGAVLIWRRRYFDARAVLEPAVAGAPDDPRLRHLLAEALEGMAQANLAEAAALRSPKTVTGPTHADGSYTITTYYPSAADLARADELEKAAIEFRRQEAEHLARALALTAGTALGAFYQGLVALGAERADQAKAEFQKAVELDPRFRAAWARLARLDEGMNLPEEWAVARMGEARFIHTTAGPWLTVARGRIAATRYQTAREALAAAAAADAADARIPAWRAVIAAAEGKPAEALAEHRAALALEQARNRLAGRDLERPGPLPLGAAEAGLTLVLRNRAAALFFQLGQLDAARRTFAANVAFLSPMASEELATVLTQVDLPGSGADQGTMQLSETYSGAKLRAQAGLDFLDWAARNPAPQDVAQACQTYVRLLVDFTITDPKPDVIRAVVNLGLAELEAGKGNLARARELLRDEGATPQPLWQEMRSLDRQVRAGQQAAEERAYQDESRRQQSLSPADRQREQLLAQRKQFQELRQNLLNGPDRPDQSVRERQLLRDSAAQYDRLIADIDARLIRLGASGAAADRGVRGVRSTGADRRR